jgi:hypothetical protein
MHPNPQGATAMPKTLKIVLILIGLYALVVTTYDAADVGADRVLVRIEHEGELFVAVNHWPRQWYGRLLDNDQVRVRFEDVDAGYTASKVPEAEQAALDTARPLGLGFRVLTGFPPRYFVRLTPNA